MRRGTRKLGYWAAITFALTLLGQGAGFFRELTYAHFFGTTALFDAFTIAFGFVLFLGSLISTILYIAIPALTKSYADSDSKEFSETLSSLILLSVAPVLLVVVLGEIFSQELLFLIGPGLVVREDTYATSIAIIRWSLPIALLMCAVHLLRSLLNLTSNFFISGLESLVFNLGIILAIAGWVGVNGEVSIFVPICGIYLAYTIFLYWGWTSMQLPIEVNWKYAPSNMNRLLISGGLLYGGTFFAYVSPLVLMWHASFLEEGASSAMGYVSRLLAFSVALFVNSVMVVFLPSASRMASENNHTALAMQTEKLLKVVLGFAIGASFMIVLEGRTLIKMIFERGNFLEADTQVLAGLTISYIPWVIFFPLSAVAVRVLYAFKKYQSFLIISIFCLLLVVLLAPILRRTWGVYGLGMASSVHMVAYGGLLLFRARKELRRLDVLGLIRSVSGLSVTMTAITTIVFIMGMYSAIGAKAQLYFVFLSILLTVLWHVNKIVNLRGLIMGSGR